MEATLNQFEKQAKTKLNETLGLSEYSDLCNTLSLANTRINRLEAEKQKLVDLCFEIGMMISTRGKGYGLSKLSIEKKGEWIAEQLRLCGFDTKPCGSSWGILKS
jgi:hypothetical protein